MTIGQRAEKRRPGSRRSASLCLGLEGNLWLWLRLWLRLRVVLLVVDVLRRRVLFLVDLVFFARGQLPAVGLAVCDSLVVDAFLLILKFGRLAGGQLPALDAFGYAALLVFLPLPPFAVAVVSGLALL